jgi:hypothetical protein
MSPFTTASTRRDRTRCNERREAFGDVADQLEQEAVSNFVAKAVAADLGHAEKRRLARSMADSVYSAKLDEIDSDLAPEQDEKLYQQCLVDARRMLLDPNYMALFS